MDSIPFHCQRCNAGASSYKHWLLHLTSDRHQSFFQQNQDVVEIELTHPSVRDKSILVGRIDPSMPLIEVAIYFSNYGILNNLLYRGEEQIFGSGYGLTTVHCILVFESEADALKVTRQMEHKINRNVVFAQKMNSDGSSSGSINDYEYEHLVRNTVAEHSYHQMPQDRFEYEQVASVVKLDLREFETDNQKTLFENTNGYQRMALQMKDDLSDLKLEEQVDGFCQLLCLTVEQLQKRVDLGNQLLKILQSRFSECSIHSFGLDFIGVSSDVDTMNVVVDPFGKMAEDQGSIHHTKVPASQKSLATQVFEMLRQQQYNLTFCKDVDIKCVPWAFGNSEIQNISFVHRESGIVCNVIVEKFLIVQESRLLRFLTTLDPRCHSLLCFARFFGSVYNTLQAPDQCFRNQIIIWLMVHFLSSKNIIPTVLELLSLSPAPLIVDNTDISFCNDKEIIQHKKIPFMDVPSIRSYSTLSLLKEFFELLSTANLTQSVVCPIIGTCIPVTAFGRDIGENFPQEVRKRYLLNADGTPKLKQFFTDCPMGLQDPLDLTTNLTKNISLVEVTRFQDLCLRAAKVLGDMLESGTGNTMEIFADLFGNQIITVGDKIFTPMEFQTEPSESEDEKESVKELYMADDEPAEDSSFELDHEDEDSDDEDSFQDIRKGRIRMSQSLRTFFESAINQAMARDDEKEKLTALEMRRKFQVLWLQYLLEFNSRFWSECFGFTVEAYSDQKVAPGEFSKTGELLASLSLREIFDLIKTDEEGYGVNFRCELRNTISEILYKKKLWKTKYLLSQMRPLWMTLTGKATSRIKTKSWNPEAQNVSTMVKVPFKNPFEFSCKLDVIFDMREDQEIPSNGALGTNAKLALLDESFGRGKKNRAMKLRFLVAVYEKLAPKYINLRVKQWIAYCCKELEYTKFNAAFKKLKKKQKGHPKWKKFRRKWKLLGRA